MCMWVKCRTFSSSLLEEMQNSDPNQEERKRKKKENGILISEQAHTKEKRKKCRIVCLVIRCVCVLLSFAVIRSKFN